MSDVRHPSASQHKLAIIGDAGFMHVNDLDQIKDTELYDRLLNEFPRWLTEAREKGILA